MFSLTSSRHSASGNESSTNVLLISGMYSLFLMKITWDMVSDNSLNFPTSVSLINSFRSSSSPTRSLFTYFSRSTTIISTSLTPSRNLAPSRLLYRSTRSKSTGSSVRFSISPSDCADFRNELTSASTSIAGFAFPLLSLRSLNDPD
uniref:(northern house mosquito) hypothetical protein n=1 Tax=Culex pipiens TaxID=7175 RepID=A0A8D8K7M0_CULPI